MRRERKNSRVIILSVVLLLWAFTGAFGGVGVGATTSNEVTEQVDETTPEADPDLATYANEQGVVDIEGLLIAIDDWRSGEIDVDLLLDVIDAWRSGEVVVRGPSEGTSWDVTVTRVIDGDTIEAEFPNGEIDTLRLLGVDTPETSLGSVSPDEFEGIPDTTDGRDHLFNWGKNATEFTNQTLANKQITIKVDEQADRRGSFDRLLVYAYANGQNFNKQLLTKGYARFFESTFSNQSEFETAEEEAQATDTGLWNYTKPSESSSPLELTEINADAEGSDYNNLNDEYIVFRNTNDTAVDLTGWTVEDETGKTYQFPMGFTLQPGDQVTLRTGTGDDTDTELYWGRDAPVWNNGGDTVIVTTADGTVVIDQAYGNSAG